jgi:acetoin utilization deacetylase AcuC-like enzyme
LDLCDSVGQQPGPGGAGRRATAKFRTAAWFTGYPSTLTDSQQVDGPYDDFWDATTGWGPLTWAPCGAAVNLTVNALARVAGQPEDAVTMVSTTIHHPMWRQC